MTLFVRLLVVGADEKAAVLRGLVNACCTTRKGTPADVFECDPAAFAEVPRSPFAYWVGEAARAVFRLRTRFDAAYFAVRGAYTTDDNRFYRLAWECPANTRATGHEGTLGRRAHVPLAKGGAFSRFYSDVYLTVRWHDDGAEPKAFLSNYRERKGWGVDWSACLNGHAHYFRSGVTWPLRTQAGLGFRAMPAGCIFGHKGPAAFVKGDEPEALLALLCIGTSSVFCFLVDLQMAFGSYEVGTIQRTPVPDLDEPDKAVLAQLARRAWSLKRSADSANETSHAFLLPKGTSEEIARFDSAAADQELASIQKEIDNRVFVLYGIGSEDREKIEASTQSGASVQDADEVEEGSADDEPADDVLTVAPIADARVSWLVGVAFGRFDIRLATGERKPPPEPEPFDPLPPRSPGMWPENEPRDVEPPAILVDDPGHKLDLTKAVATVAERVGADEPDKLRGWLAKELFPLHIKMYSKSRRKAPIYWQLATPTASYSVWLYLHAFTKDTFFHVQDLVTAKAEHEERVLERLRNEQARDGSTAASRKTLAAQETFVDELRGMVEEVKRVKPLWQPDLDDGVVINFAPLWRLVPHHKPWQKELRTTWDALVAGEYDWAHLAMHLWPERVVPKCATDRSLAIAHGLEDVFWFEDDAGKWKPRATPTRPVAELIAERTSAAVQAARDSLLSAVAPGGGGGSGKARRKRPTGPRSRR